MSAVCWASCRCKSIRRPAPRREVPACCRAVPCAASFRRASIAAGSCHAMRYRWMRNERFSPRLPPPFNSPSGAPMRQHPLAVLQEDWPRSRPLSAVFFCKLIGGQLIRECGEHPAVSVADPYLNLAPSWVTMYVFMAEPSPTTAVAIGACRYRGIRLCV